MCAFFFWLFVCGCLFCFVVVVVVFLSTPAPHVSLLHSRSGRVGLTQYPPLTPLARVAAKEAVPASIKNEIILPYIYLFIV